MQPTDSAPPDQAQKAAEASVRPGDGMDPHPRSSRAVTPLTSGGWAPSCGSRSASPAASSWPDPRYGEFIRWPSISELAPKREDWYAPDDVFNARYLDQLDREAETIDLKLRTIHPGVATLVLCCFERRIVGPECHRRLAAGWLKRRYGITIPELDFLRDQAAKEPARWIPVVNSGSCDEAGFEACQVAGSSPVRWGAGPECPWLEEAEGAGRVRVVEAGLRQAAVAGAAGSVAGGLVPGALDAGAAGVAGLERDRPFRGVRGGLGSARWRGSTVS